MEGWKEKPPSTNRLADGGHRTTNEVNPMSTATNNLLMQTRCQEKAPTDQPSRKPMGAKVVAYLLQGRATKY